MACLFAARLSAAGISVAMAGTWPEGLQALRQHGVRLLDAVGVEHRYPVTVVSGVEECPAVRYAVVLVKSWQTETAARLLAQRLQANGLALTLQNGLGNHEVLAAALGEERAANGVMTVGADLLGPGCVKLAGEGKISLGQHPRLGPLEHMLRQTGFQVDTTPDTKSLQWGKLVINAAINPLTALLNATNGELLERPAARSLMRKTALEAASVATVLGIRLPYPDPVQTIERIAGQTAANRSSMLQDVLRGAQTEIDAINGAIVRAGERAGVATPVNETLWKLVQSLRKTK